VLSTTTQEPYMNLMPRLLKTAGALAVAMAATASFAQEPTPTPRVDQRQENQQARIDQGAASGSLTGREQRRLQREQRGIARSEAHANADGKVTARERRRLHRQQNAASADIARQKHDRQRAHKPAALSGTP
jgi:hypothetical protein